MFSVKKNPRIVFFSFQNGEKNWLTGRANDNDVDLNRNFPKLNQKAYRNEQIGGKNNHLESFKEAIHTKGVRL